MKKEANQAEFKDTRTTCQEPLYNGHGREGPLLVLCTPTLLPNCCMQSVSAQRDMEDLLPLSFPFELQQYQNGRFPEIFLCLFCSSKYYVVPLHVCRKCSKCGVRRLTFSWTLLSHNIL